MSIEAIKEKVMSFVETADNSALERLSNFIDEEQSPKDWWHELPDEVKTSIDEGIRDADAGRVLNYEEYKKSRPQWFTK